MAQPHFTPRIQQVERGPAPFAPSSYFIVGFFGGIIAIGAVAVMNMSRFGARKAAVRDRTVILLAVMAAAGLAFLAFSPPDLWDAGSTIRLGLRVVALVGGLGLKAVHGPAALGAVATHEDFTSMWKAWVPILVGALIQGAITVAFGFGRGLMG